MGEHHYLQYSWYANTNESTAGLLCTITHTLWVKLCQLSFMIHIAIGSENFFGQHNKSSDNNGIYGMKHDNNMTVYISIHNNLYYLFLQE